MNTNRRSFIKLMAGVTAAVAMDVLGLKAQATTGVKMLKAKITRVIANPDYVNAEYEETFSYIYHPKVWKTMRPAVSDPPFHSMRHNRYDLVDGEYVARTFYKEVVEEIEIPDDGSWKPMELLQDPAVRKVQTNWPREDGGIYNRIEVVQRCLPGHVPGKGWEPIKLDATTEWKDLSFPQELP